MKLGTIIKTAFAGVLTAGAISTASAEEKASEDFHSGSHFTNNIFVQSCVGDAIDAITIDGAETYSSDKNAALTKLRTETFESSDPLNPIKQNIVQARIELWDEGKISFYAVHDGTLGDKIDAVTSNITLQYDYSQVTAREGLVSTDDFGTSYSDTAHGTWTVQAVQTMESVYTDCMNLRNPDRPASAATTVGKAPEFPQP